VSRPTEREADSQVALLVTLVAVAASVSLALTLPATVALVAREPGRVATFLVLTLVLQVLSVPVYGRGSISVAATGALAAGFALGAGPAMMIAVPTALAQWLRRGGRPHRAIFDAANFALSSGLGALAYQLLASLAPGMGFHILAATAAGVVYNTVNYGLLCLAMGLSEGEPALRIWRERFRWARFHLLAFGPLALASAVAYDVVGVAGLIAFVLPPGLMLLSVRQYLERTRVAVDEVRQANEHLEVANTSLAARNDDLRLLLGFAGGLAANSHERESLVSYAEASLSRLTGGHARIRLGEGDGGIPLVLGGEQVGTLSLVGEGSLDRERWQRLGDAILPQLATVIAGVQLVERVRKTHLDTIAALSRSMEAKDLYTGGHTERVAAISVALARRLGYSGAELDAIEIGALLHDIGKIGIPERILHKPAALDDEEWTIMRTHPVVSDTILREVDLPLIVRQIARSSHERIDGRGYPDGLEGAAIPLPARIVFVADAFDALTTDRPYRAGRHTLDALAELRANTGTQFCPTVMGAVDRVMSEEPHVLATGLRAVEVA
jgi:putative nucleotidyltransferase with HDIG domain